MNKGELLGILENDLFCGKEADCVIMLDQTGIGGIAISPLSTAYDGFDWEMGKFVLVPESPLVSWEYLEKIHPGIREQIEEEQRAYARRPVRCIVAGSRSFGYNEAERETIRQVMVALCCPPYTTADRIEIVSGCARGVDSTSAEIARELGYAVKEFPADWDAYGKAAGHMRNKQMADYACEDDSRWRAKLLAFWDGESKGTQNMIETARKMGMAVSVVNV